MYRHSVQCTDIVCSVQTQCAVYRHSVQCTDIVCSVRMAGSREVCSLEVFSVHWDVCILHYVVCSVRCAVSSVMCAVCSVQFAELVLKWLWYLCELLKQPGLHWVMCATVCTYWFSRTDFYHSYDKVQIHRWDSFCVLSSQRNTADQTLNKVNILCKFSLVLRLCFFSFHNHDWLSRPS